MLTETIARHFDDAQIDENEVDLGIAGLHIACTVDSIREIGSHRSAALFFNLWGGALGDTPIFASMSGYGASEEEAVITGGCNWACVFGSVLKTALADAPPEEADTFEVVVQEQGYRVVVDGLDRAMFFGGDEGETGERVQAARTHLGAAPWLVTNVLAEGALPMLPSTRASVLSVFASDGHDNRILEIKVNGCDWPPSQHLLDQIPESELPGTVMLRELAVLVPQGGATLIASDLLTSTLEGAALEVCGELRGLVDWIGWGPHKGVVGKPASDIEVKRLETKIGRLPDDYRQFILSVQASGAGPGYGLLSPFAAEQQSLASGEFVWRDGEEPDGDPAGVLALAHAGCGVVWLLVLGGQHEGEVWVHAVGSDGLVRRVAPDFISWYRDWIDALVRNDRVFAQWDAACCATPSVLSQMIDAREKEGIATEEAVAELSSLDTGSIGIMSGGGRYFGEGDPLDPCQSCCAMVSQLGIGLDVFKPGIAPKQGRERKQGVLGRLFGKRPK